MADRTPAQIDPYDPEWDEYSDDAWMTLTHAERDALVAVVRASLALHNARTGPDLIAAEKAWRAALAPFMEADRG